VSIDQPKVIDFLGINKSDGCCVLTISDHLEWNSWEHLLALQEKVNNYLAFIESGEIYDNRPDAQGRAVEISIRCKFLPEGEDDWRFLQLARDTIQSAGFRFSVISGTGEIQIPETKANKSWRTNRP
jgi:hypothetical protein